jgi:pimeloyl-ACP methyl ester carboxylesterase/DNA-binding CsgD family transcriptional regulator
MEPVTQYARTEDGLSIAFWSTGSGPPLIHMPWLPWSHAQLEWRNDEVRGWFEELAGFSRVVRYDGRGAGLSERAVEAVGVEDQLRDLEAVIERLGLKRIALLGVYHSGPAAITFAARHPEMVSALILWCTYARGRDYYASRRVKSILALIEDWELYTETGAHAFVGWSGEAAHDMAVIMRESVTPEVAKLFFETMGTVDCTPLLSRVDVPTLVIQPRHFPLIDLGLAQQLAAAIPDARFLAVEGDSLAPMHADLPEIVEAIRDLVQTTAEADLAESLGHAGYALTGRQIEVLRLLAEGRSNREIADLLVLSTRTVERHVLNIYAKIEVNNRAQATAFALSHGISKPRGAAS